MPPPMARAPKVLTRQWQHQSVRSPRHKLFRCARHWVSKDRNCKGLCKGLCKVLPDGLLYCCAGEDKGRKGAKDVAGREEKSDIYKLVKMVMERGYDPVNCFALPSTYILHFIAVVDIHAMC